MPSRKAFISYSWTSREHGDWVIQLATQLAENGVEVILDKWDLKEGHDATVFMEKMVTDPELKKVIVVLDRVYAERADMRKGGVGTETQIISAEVYQKADQDKFVAVLAERDAEGKPFLPTYYKSRIYIDLSDPDSYAANFDQLLRWIYDKPLHVRPSLGKPPAFLDEDTAVLATHTRARRALELIRNNAPGAGGALDDYLFKFADEIEKFRIPADRDEVPFDDVMIENIERFLPYRDEYIEAISTLSRYWPLTDGEQHIHRFLERIAAYLFRPRSATNWRTTDFDNFLFLVHEIFLYTIAVLIRHERFDAVSWLLSTGYYLGEHAESRFDPMGDFRIFRADAESFRIRNARLNLRRLSLRADMLEQRSQSSGVPFAFLMQADFLIFLRSSVDSIKAVGDQWWPETLLYAGRFGGPFEIFARAQSARYFERIKGMIGVSGSDELRDIVSKFNRAPDAQLHTPGWEHNYIKPKELIGIDKLSTRP